MANKREFKSLTQATSKAKSRVTIIVDCVTKYGYKIEEAIKEGLTGADLSNRDRIEIINKATVRLMNTNITNSG